MSLLLSVVIIRKVALNLVLATNTIFMTVICIFRAILNCRINLPVHKVTHLNLVSLLFLC